MEATIKSIYRECIDACHQCIIDCQFCLAKMAPQQSHNDCPLCCVQCVESCQACLKMMVVDSRWAKDYCRLCAEICDYCAEQCGAHDHAHCQKCAESCRECARACRALAA